MKRNPPQTGRREGIGAVPGAIAAVLCAGVLLMLLFAAYHIYPFGENTVVWCDMVQQGVPLLEQLKRMAERGEWLGYTALDAGGMQFYGVFFFFLSNPFSFLVFLTDLRADQLVGLLTAAKLALSAGTAAFWLKRHNPKLSPGLQILLGMMYGCCGYGFFYYQNLMWLDILALFPLLMWGLERLFFRQKPAAYCVVLCMMMVSCYYLCYMAALFILLFGSLSLRFTVSPEKRKQTAVQFFGASFAAACLTAPVWLTCFLQISRSARTVGLIVSLAGTPLMCRTEDKLAVLLGTGLGIAVIPALKGAADRVPEERFQRGWRIFVLLAAAVLLDPVNTMWHTGSYQAFPLRWGMFPVLLLLGCAADLLASPDTSAKKPKKRALILCCLMIPVTLGTVYAVIVCAGDTLFSYCSTLWVGVKQFAWLLLPAAAAAAAYYMILRLRKTNMLSQHLCAVMMLPLCIAETVLGFHCYVGNAGGEDTQYAQTFAMQDVIQDSGFFRVSTAAKYLHPNMIGAVGYPSIAHYTSLTRADFLSGIKRFGYSSYWMEVSGCGGTLLSDAIWANRYQVGGAGDRAPWMREYWADGHFEISENTLRLPTVLYADAEPDRIADLPEGSRASVQAYLAETFLGEAGAVTEYPVTLSENAVLTQDEKTVSVQRPDAQKDGMLEFSVFIKGRQALYFDLSSHTDTQLSMPYHHAVSVKLNGKTASADYPTKGGNGLLYLGTVENNFCTVKVQIMEDISCESFGVFGMDLDRLESACAAAAGTEFTYENGVYTAECTADTSKTLIFSAAYDEGFTAEIDGSPALVYRVNGCQLAVRMPAGTHRITLTHHISGMMPALCIAGFG
ncbi:MAG: YfhO family protein, partial [Oscillospiraceae bacterium]|nr:YfhO family protein [Oscillospiraceae bacterium]